MKHPSKGKIVKLKREALKSKNWERVAGFKASKPTSIRLSTNLVHNLQLLAKLRGERSYQSLLKQWVTDQVNYELKLIELIKHKKAG